MTVFSLYAKPTLASSSSAAAAADTPRVKGHPFINPPPTPAQVYAPPSSGYLCQQRSGFHLFLFLSSASFACVISAILFHWLPYEERMTKREIIAKNYRTSDNTRNPSISA